MKKGWIIGVGVLIIVILAGIYIYQKDYSPYSGNASRITQEELNRGFYYGFENQKKPGTPDNWTWIDAGRSSGWSAPQDSKLVGGCGGVYYHYWSECCDNWARDNNFTHASCIGNWTVENNTCEWECNTTGHKIDDGGIVYIKFCESDSDCIQNYNILENNKCSSGCYNNKAVRSESCNNTGIVSADCVCRNNTCTIIYSQI